MTCAEQGIVAGFEDGTFSGESNMTRAQASKAVIRMMNLINGSTPEAPAQPEQPQQPENPTQSEPGKLANGKDIAEENVLEILAEIKALYPAGTTWGCRDTPNTNYYTDCAGSADMPALTQI